MITQERLRELFVYQDGNLLRNGKIAGSINTKGYCIICVDYKLYKAHRLVFLYHHGYLSKQIDHIDGNKLNNDITNLRAANNSVNMMNRGVMRNNTSGCKGVFWDKEFSKWRVAIGVNKKLKSFGRFVDKELADLVAVMAREKYHKEYANHGV
jgi:hypothetical protein